MIPKFRGWHNELGRMMSIKNMWFQDGSVEELELNDAVMNDYITAYPDEIELMQSTGLKDKNGKEIFEGDIITNGPDVMCMKRHNTLGFYVEEKGEVEFIADSAVLEDFEEDAKEIADRLEIIGNIYENTELLEVTE
nr:MAG TPA: YopX protein [Caudoviricetes sp.]